MITTLEELQLHTERWAVEAPIIAKYILLASPGYSKEQLAKLTESLPGISESYLDCVAKLKLKSVMLNGFSLWPEWLGEKSDMLDEIIYANTSYKNPLLKLYQSKKLYEVASYEGDSICIASTITDEPGYVYWLDRSSGPDIEINRMCDSFEKFLLCAGNLQDVATKHHDEDNKESAVREFVEALKVMQLDDEETKSWESIAKMSL
ncbi:MAG TPA: hypothetical protein DHD79_03300 [Firmicutes bacterium]|jgi:hypothetical protein|nr:hypothetical protein [Bacillota bacterium]HAZ22232.1 hypothetical protein [Bacillota bacterium]HBE05524.1 hypothetical protein [Bacillota bacterium]HBR23761.1 hypothetical protein [Bacillota bacterium]HCF91763.1 hypothetical protein [Bacillota bacterium]